MKPSELRIGNIIECEDEYIVSVKEIIFKSEKYHNNYWLISEALYRDYKCNYPIESYHPIPLTEEWLVKFGFTKVESMFKDGSDDYTHGMCFINSTDSVISFRGKGHADFSSIKFVHQLQNLYYALTSEELTIKTT